MSDQLIDLKDPKDVYDLVLKIYNEFQNVIAREVQPYNKGQRVLIVGRAVNLLHQQTFSTVLEVGERAIKDLDNVVKTEDLPWNQDDRN